MTNNTILLPVLTHMVTAILCIFFNKRIAVQKVISTAGNIIAFLLSWRMMHIIWDSGIQSMQAGGWKAPFGITFVADTLTGIMLLLTAISGTAVGIFSTAGISKPRMQFGYFTIFHFLLMGLNGAFLAGDIFNLYVWFEIVIISSFVLMTLGGKKPQMEGAIKYVAMNLLASALFLTAIGILYGLTGSLNMADLSRRIAQVENRGLVNVIALLFFVGFGIKSAVFPLYFWLPSSYHTPPSAIAAIFGGLLTKLGIYALLRVFTLIFIPDPFNAGVFIVIAIATMLTGALGAINKYSIRRMFSYLIVCHIGYLIAGIGLYTEIALTGAVFYLIHDIIVKTNVFLVSGIIYKIRGSTDMRRLGGLYKDYPMISFLIAIVLFSLVGIPPLSGFWPKINLIQACLENRSYLLLATILIASFITLYVIAKMWTEVIWKEYPKPPSGKENDYDALPLSQKAALLTPIALLAAVSLYIGLNAQKIYSIAERIAFEMKHPAGYLNAVLGNGVSG